MYKLAMEPYEGDAPYIFVSYSHKDSERVWPIIDKLHDQGYRIWFDDGVHIGDEWVEAVAVHLKNSRIVLAFISPNYVDSENCIRELNYSMDQNKIYACIMLDRAKLSEKIEFQLSGKYRFPLYQKSEAELYRDLSSSASFKECRTDAQTDDTVIPPGPRKKSKMPLFAGAVIVVACIIVGFSYIKSLPSKNVTTIPDETSAPVAVSEAPSSTPEKKTPSADDLKAYTGQIAFPDKTDYLDEYLEATVVAPKGHSVLGFGSSKPSGTGTTVLDGEEVVVLAEHHGYSCVIIKSQDKARWINSDYLVISDTQDG